MGRRDNARLIAHPADSTLIPFPNYAYNLLTRIRWASVLTIALTVPFITIGLLANPARADNCSTFDLACHIGGLSGDIFGLIAQAFIDGVALTVKAVATLWVLVPTPELASDASGTPSDTVGFLQSSLSFYTGCLALIAFLIGITRIAWAHHRGARTDATSSLARSVVTWIVVNGCGLAVVWILVQAGDAFAKWIIQRSTGNTDFAANITAVLALGTISGIGAIVIALLGLFCIIFSIGQIFAMIARGGALVVIAGLMPTFSSFRNLEVGDAWFRRGVAWLSGLICYKPAAAIIYATAFRLTGQHVFGNDGIINVCTGLIMLILAVIAMPALMKFAVPLVAIAHFNRGGGGGGGGGVVPSGAAQILGQYANGRGNSGGSGGSNGPTGSTGGPGGHGPTGSGTPGPTGPSGSGAGAGAGAASGAAGGASGAAAGAAGGPVGVGVAAGAAAAHAAAGAARSTADKATGGDTE